MKILFFIRNTTYLHNRHTNNVVNFHLDSQNPVDNNSLEMKIAYFEDKFIDQTMLSLSFNILILILYLSSNIQMPFDHLL